jgi:hypothetical protein
MQAVLVRKCEADERGGGDDEREGHGEEKDADERCRGNDPVGWLAKCALGNLEKRLDDDDEDGRFDAEERCLDERHMAIERVGNAQCEHDESAGQHEEEACHKATQVPWSRQPI